MDPFVVSLSMSSVVKLIHTNEIFKQINCSWINRCIIPRLQNWIAEIRTFFIDNKMIYSTRTDTSSETRLQKNLKSQNDSIISGEIM